MPARLPDPPSDVTGALGRWLRDVHRVIQAMPQISYASFAATDTPNSRVTGFPGDLCTNIASVSTTSRLWVLGGADRSVLTNQGWALVRVVEL
jgi:hypothetical protein